MNGCFRFKVSGFWLTALIFLATAGRARAAGESPQPAPTFNKDIAPLVFKNCATCHHPGEVAPFPLLGYEDVKKRTAQIVRVTKSRYMPPWKAEPGHGEFMDSRRLSDEQVALIAKWVDAGAPEGEASDLPPAPKFADGWPLGEPDLILKMPEAYTVPAEGRDIYRCFVLPLDVPADKYVQAIEFRPSNRKVVHHALFFLDSMGQARRKDAQDPAPGFKTGGGPGFVPTGSLGGWAPGASARRLPEGIGRLMKKGSDLVVQTHFHPSGKPEQEQSSIGIYFAKEKPEKLLTTFPLRSHKIDIPPGEKAFKVRDSVTAPIDLQLVGITPHAHLVCKDMKVNATFPDGTVKPLIWIKDWDFNWQEQYLYAAPLKIPKGTKVDMEFTYDNSADNVRNPNTPPKRVTWGEQTADEMALVFLQVVPEKAGEASELRRGMATRAVRTLAETLLPGGARTPGDEKRAGMLKELMQQFDKNGDGRLDDEERAEAVKKLQETIGQ